MRAGLSDTAERLVAEAALLIMRGGYAGFSYADLAEKLGIRKPSIHFHFPSKVDLVVAVVERGRSIIQSQIAALDGAKPEAMDQLLTYTGYWKTCIKDQTAPFCLAAVLASELPSLPQNVGSAVRGHFVDLARWLTEVLKLGKVQGSMRYDNAAEFEADRFMAGVYGAMLVARAFDDHRKFDLIVDKSIADLQA